MKTQTMKADACAVGLPSAEAEVYCRSLMHRLESEQNIDFNPAESGGAADPRLSTDPLFGDARGQMFGVLVCRAENTSPAAPPVILKAFSGQYNGVWTVPGWAPPLIDPAAFSAAVRLADPAIKRLTEEIKIFETMPASGDKRRLELIEKRKRLSRRHMREIHEMYTIRNFNQDSTDLFSLFRDRNGIPAGTGDCCAPKLLNQAIIRNLAPLSLAEFYWGRDNRSGTKRHGMFYPPCSDKCGPLLKYMLSGIRDA